jgi:multiple sugar transport system ATP-binding protein
MSLVGLEHLTKVFKGLRGESVRAVDNISLAVAENELLVLVGPSGCGKTTTLRIIAGLEEAYEGTVSIDGKVLNAVPPGDRDVAMVFQNYALFPHMSAYENMGFGLKVRKCAKAEIDQRVKEAAELLGITACLGRKPRELSGGERQRVALGRAIVRRPRVFLFDEPLSNLDAATRRQMRAEIVRLHRRLAATIIYVTHDQEEALTLGSRIAVMRQGTIQQVADPVELYRRPANLFVAGFIGSPPMNFFRGTIVTQGDVLLFQERTNSSTHATPPIALPLNDASSEGLWAYDQKEIVLGIRPENIVRQNMGADSARPGPVVEAAIEGVQHMGSETHIQCTSASHSFVARVPASDNLRVNERLRLAFEMPSARFFDPATGKAIG